MTTNEKNSPQKKKPCVFPWIDPWTKKKNEGCAAPDGDEYGVWCPTKVNDDMKYVDGEGNWGYCNEKCLINSNLPANLSFLNQKCSDFQQCYR